MKKIILFSLLLLLFVGCSNEPSLYFPSSEILLGAKLGTEKEINIPIENKGNKPLIIKSVNSSCKCINIHFPKNKIRKGKKAYIDMTFVADKAGPHSESIVIISNDPKVYKLIRITADVAK